MRLPDAAASRGVLIGTTSYRHDRLADIPAVRNNLTDLLAALTKPPHGGFERARCTVVMDKPRVDECGMLLERAARAAEDVLLVYYAGHGVLDDQGRLYLAFHDTDPDRPRFTALSLGLVKEIFNESAARNRILILDCCFSGRAVGAMAGTGDLIQGQLDVDGTYILTSTSQSSPAFALPDATHSAFTAELLALMHDGLHDGGEYLPLRAVYGHLRIALKQTGFPEPRQGSTQTADMLALTRNPAARLGSTGSGGADEEPDPAARRAPGPRRSRRIAPADSGWETTALLADLKRNLADPTRRIAVEDTFRSTTARALDAFTPDRYPAELPDLDEDEEPAALEGILSSYEEDLRELTAVLATGAHYGGPGVQPLAGQAIDRLAAHRRTHSPALRGWWQAVRAYPALVAGYTCGVSAMGASRSDDAFALLSHPLGDDSGPRPLAAALIPFRVVDPDLAATMPRWGGRPRRHALGAHIRITLRRAFADILSDAEYLRAFEDYEILRSLLEFDLMDVSPLGEFADALADGRTTLSERVDALIAKAPLAAGAFGGDPLRAQRAGRRLREAARVRAS